MVAVESRVTHGFFPRDRVTAAWVESPESDARWMVSAGGGGNCFHADGNVANRSQQPWAKTEGFGAAAGHVFERYRSAPGASRERNGGVFVEQSARHPDRADA